MLVGGRLARPLVLGNLGLLFGLVVRSLLIGRIGVGLEHCVLDRRNTASDDDCRLVLEVCDGAVVMMTVHGNEGLWMNCCVDMSCVAVIRGEHVNLRYFMEQPLRWRRLDCKL